MIPMIRGLIARLAQPCGQLHFVPFDDPDPSGVTGIVTSPRPVQRTPSHCGADDPGCPNPTLHPACYPPGFTWEEHERLMRHTGRPECPIAEHADALRRLGRAIIERDTARQERDLWVARCTDWVHHSHALLAQIAELECRLRRPARQEPDAA